VLGFIIAQLLYARFSRADEGQLTRLRSNLVKGATLAELARELNLGQYLLLGPGEAKSGGAHRKSTLEDTVEAIIGALYLDAGLERCREIVSQWFLPRVDAISLQANPRDAKTTLQEYLQSEGIKLPTYQLLRTEGQEHDQTFYVLCEVSEKGWKTEGSGKTRKAAEQMAAQTLLDQVYASQSS
ncbi:MAG: ribonuclease III, partial [Gammaproteobacteria bacterium]|nr:ribonuclease III [Gammaproteobacteria bacterium]